MNEDYTANIQELLKPLFPSSAKFHPPPRETDGFDGQSSLIPLVLYTVSWILPGHNPPSEIHRRKVVFKIPVSEIEDYRDDSTAHSGFARGLAIWIKGHLDNPTPALHEAGVIGPDVEDWGFFQSGAPSPA